MAQNDTSNGAALVVDNLVSHMAKAEYKHLVRGLIFRRKGLEVF